LRAGALLLALLLAQLLLPATAQAQDSPLAPPPPLEGAAEMSPSAQTVKLISNKDTFIASNEPNSNFGYLDNLDAGWYGAFGAVRPLIKFDLDDIPGNAKVYGAQLVIYLDFALPANDFNMQLDAARITQDWSEGGATWNNAAGTGGPEFVLGNISAQPGWASFDLTSQVQNWVNGQGNNGLMIIGDETPSLSRARIFRSRHYGGFEPYLLVNYECDTLAPISQMSGLPPSSPASFTVSWSGQDRAPSGCQPSGLRRFHVQYRVNGGSWVDWHASTTRTSDTFSAQVPNGARVDFRVWADDNAGNVEQTPSNPQASTIVVTQAPEVIFSPLPAVTNLPSFTVAWNATEDPEGVANFDIQYQVNGGPWIDLLIQTTQTSYLFTNTQSGQTYGFRGRARDNAGNVGEFPASAQTQTTVSLLPQASVTPFNPNIITSTSPVTTSFTVNWSGTSPAGPITSYTIWYQVTSLSGVVLQSWSQWQPSTSSTSATFQVTHGSGVYGFEATATNQYGTSAFTGQADSAMIVDLNDTIQPALFLPVVRQS
jgi:hypothetical protein